MNGAGQIVIAGAKAAVDRAGARAKELGAKRVVPGDPDKSELVHVLKHTSLSGCARTPKMPDNQPMLNQTEIDLVVSWIKSGAKSE